MRNIFPIAVLLVACTVPEPENTFEPDPTEVGSAWRVVQPEEMISFIESLETLIPMESGCPLVEVYGDLTQLTGDCVLSDGTYIGGSLERFDDGDSAWITTDDFSIWRERELILSFQGAAELWGEEDLLYLTVAADSCGLGADCSFGITGLDLRYSLIIAEENYDVSVRGMMILPVTGAIEVEGAWQQNKEECALEPVAGLFSLEGQERHTLRLDGAERCDACADWTVAGQEAPIWCPAQL